MGHSLPFRLPRLLRSTLVALAVLASGASAQRTADFTADVTSGDLPLTVSFTDESSGRPDAWDWDFGDGTTSKEQNPVHQYATGGFFTVSLRTTYNLPFEEVTETKVGYIRLADFTASATTGVAPFATTFTIVGGVGTVTDGTWDFGDGTPPVPATGVSQSHTYENPGLFNVTLTLDGPSGSDTEIKLGFIAVSPPAPTLASVTPNIGPAGGGNVVTLAGTGFQGGGLNTVRFGANVAKIVSIAATEIMCEVPAGTPGTTVPVEVENANGTGTLSPGYTYLNQPVLTGLVPDNGSADGDTVVVLQGSNFTGGGAVTVTFGGMDAPVSATTDTTVTCTSPPGTAGTSVDVVVTNSNGSDTLANGFTYNPRPSLIDVNPDSGTPLGGTLVTVLGMNLDNGGLPVVLFGANPATEVALMGPSSLTCRTPAGTPGSTVSVTVTTTNGTANLPAAFTYNQAPDLISLDPTSGSILGGTAVRLTGTGFSGTPTVTFGGVTAMVTASTGTTIDCVSPVPPLFLGGSSFFVDVAVTTENGSDSLENAFQYLNTPQPGSLNPAEGPPSGNTTVTISGFALDLGTDPTVTFGGAAATVDSFNGLTIVCRTPAGVPGQTVDVVVTNDLGSGTLPNAFTYLATPILTDVSPDSGTPLGGTQVTITGENFQTGGAVSVTFGGAQAMVDSSTNSSIVCRTPEGTPGATVDVVVTTGNGSGTAVGAFTYLMSPSIAGVVPSNGPAGGGTEVVISGANFATGVPPTVTFGGQPATMITGNNTQITCQTPPGVAGSVVDVVVSNSNGSGTLIGGFTYDAITQPVVDFVGDVLTGPAPHTVQFTDLTTGTADVWLWEFGDGMSSKEQNPTHVYNDAGTYDVTLTVIGGGVVSDFATKLDYITVGEPVPVASFSGNPLSGAAPLEVIFTDLSSGPVTAWTWDFGDGSGSAEQNPTHEYTAAGTYSVSLDVVGPGGADDITLPNYVTVGEPVPTAAFQGLPNAVSDGFFGAGDNGGIWTETGDPLCSVDVCTDVPSDPLAALFFGDTVAVLGRSVLPATDAIEQTIIVPPGSDTLAFALSIPTSSGNGTDTLQVSIDGVVIFELTNPTPGEFELVGSSMVAFADGQPHTLRIESMTSGPDPTLFYIGGVFAGKLGDFSLYSAAIINGISLDLSGEAPFQASFLDLSAGNVTSWNWDFGDGSPPSTQDTPTHAYDNPGTYTVTLTASGPGGADDLVKVDYVTVLPPAPSAEFESDVQTGDAALAVQFTDLSVGNVTAWSWDFGDGGTSSLQDPSHVYATPGTFDVTLVVTNTDKGSDTETKLAFIVVDEPAPEARFKGSPTSGTSPLTVQFNDFSTLNITDWNWDFGDGTTSTEQNPTHVYANATTGTLDFDVSLTVTNVDGVTDTETKPGYVSVQPALPVAAFSGAPTSGGAPLSVAFTDASTGAVTAWSWNFGDKATSTLQNPTHDYLLPGLYTVTLTVTGPSGVSTETLVDYITVNPDPVVAIAAAAPLTGVAPLTVTFTDLSSGPVTSRLWNFDDAGATSTEVAPMHTFNDPGTYSVMLTATGSTGSSSDMVEIVVTPPPPVVLIVADPTTGSAPLTVGFTAVSVSGPATDVLWDFGFAGGSSTLVEPTFTYTAPGTYTVSVTLTGPGGSDTAIETDLIVVTEAAPVADFSATPTSGVAVLEVAFEDRSTGDVTSYSWDFGDGTASREENPTKFYQDPGTYTVSLTVAGPSGIDNETKVDYIVVQDPPPLAAFSGVPRAGTAPLTVQFIDFSTGPVVQWDWSFGDLLTETILAPALDGSTSHTYTDPGQYTVALTVNGAGGNTETKVGYITILAPQPAVNDDCAAALFLECTDPDTGVPVGMGDLTLATTAADDPVPSCGVTDGGTLWYRIVSTGATVGVSARPLNPGDEALVAIYDGTCGAGNLIELACDTSPPGGGGSAIAGTSGLTPGGVYYVMVAAPSTGTAGPVELILSCNELEANDTCAMATEIFCGDVLTGNNRNATSSPDDPPFACASGGPLQGAGTLWFSFIANATTASLDTNLSTVQDTLLAVYSGDCGNLTQIACSDDMGVASLSQLTVTGLTPGERYLVQVATRILEPSGTIQLRLDCAVPANDDCARALPLPFDSPFSTDNSTATEEVLDPMPSCLGPVLAEQSVWFSFVAPPSGTTTARVDLKEEDLAQLTESLVLAAYDGTCGAFTELGCSSSGVLNLTGLVPGETYFLAVTAADGVGSADAGAFTLLLEVTNDECLGAFEILCGDTATSDTATATTSIDDPGFSCHPGGAGTQGFGSVWFRFVATGSQADLDTNLSTGSTDTLLAVYDGTCGALIELACSDADGTGLLSQLSVTGLTAGNTYFVQVASFSEATSGEVTLRLDCSVDPNVGVGSDDCATAGEILCGGTAIGDTSTATTVPGDPGFSCHFSGPGTQGFGSIWFKFVSNGLPVNLDTNLSTGSTDTLLAVYEGTCGALTEIACSEDEGTGLLSQIVGLGGLTLGETYYVQVAAFSEASAGAVTLRLECVTPFSPIAGFSADRRSGPRPLVVSFTDESVGMVTSWNWDFGDGTTSTLQNPTHTYTTVGDFAVTLEVTGPGGKNQQVRHSYILVPPGNPAQAGSVPVKVVQATDQAAFWAGCPGQNACLDVQFLNTSLGQWNRQFWIFGDDPGATFPTAGVPGSGDPDSTAMNPVHVYDSEGTYTVQLLVRRQVSPGVFEEDTLSREIVVNQPLRVFGGGSFEFQMVREIPRAPWESYGGLGQRVHPDVLVADHDMPTHGNRWLELSSEGTREALPPSVPGGETLPPRGAAGLRQSFLFDPANPGLAFEAAFLLDGLEDSGEANDFMSVDVTDGTTWFNLFYADTHSEFVRLSEVHGLPMTATASPRVWLDELFPRADGTTTLELVISVGNGGEDVGQSRGYVDHFRTFGEASATVRRGLGLNLECYESSSAALGSLWTARMSAEARPSATLLILLAHERGSDGVLMPGMGELLIDVSSRELFSLSQLPSSEGNVFTTLIPDDPALAGRTIYTQGFLATGERVLACEAVDLKLGVDRD